MKWLKGKKTYIVAVIMGIVSVLDVLTGNMTVLEFFQSPNFMELLAAFGLGTLRAGVKKVEKNG